MHSFTLTNVICISRCYLGPSIYLAKRLLLLRHVSVVSSSLTALVIASHVPGLGLSPRNCYSEYNTDYFKQLVTRQYSKMSASGSSPTRSTSPKRSSSPKPSQPPVIIKPKEEHTATVSGRQIPSVIDTILTGDLSSWSW